MTAIVFVGPTLEAGEVAAVLDAECRPPAAQGDVYRAVLDRPSAIGIVDGYFDGVPSVWHKEILWAMAEGIPVFGSASMGALRAAELWPFGMRGIGRIFEDYRDGRLEDDDEVAVLHAPAELGFRPLSEPMVSIRATLEEAAEAGAIPAGLAADLGHIAKGLNYRDRSWERVLGLAAEAGVEARALEALRGWLATGRVDLKREDALAMLRAMAADRPADAPAADYSFEWTRVWNGLTERVETETAATGHALERVLDELRLDPAGFEAFRRRAALRRLALDEARRRNLSPERSEVRDAISRHRERHGLLRRRDLTAWLEENEVTERDYETLARESRLAEAGADLPPEALARHVVAELKWSGEFAALRSRALEKADALAAAAHGPSRAGADRLNILVWYFERRLGEPVPEDLDGHARSLGLASREELYRVLEREYLYSLARQEDAGTAEDR